MLIFYKDLHFCQELFTYCRSGNLNRENLVGIHSGVVRSFWMDHIIILGGGEGVGQLNKILHSKSRQEKFIYSKPKVKLHKLKVKKILQKYDKK